MKPLAIGALLLAGILSPLGGTAHRKTEAGNRSYEEGAFEDALRHYTEAQVAAPEAPELHYDIGNVLYRQQDYKGAAEAFTRALLSAPPALAPRAAYNLGNALFRQEQFAEAVKAYRRALEKTPDDADAKRNLELALRALAEQRQQQQQQQQSPDEPPRDGQERPQQSPADPGGPDEPRPPEPGSGGDDSGERKDSDEAPGRSMTPEEAQRLLDRLSEQEKENVAREARRRARAEAGAPEHDW